MNDTTKFLISIGIMLATLYLYKEFLESVEHKIEDYNKKSLDMMLDFHNKTQQEATK